MDLFSGGLFFLWLGGGGELIIGIIRYVIALLRANINEITFVYL